uniref:C1q domain-containing protein n=2 Tax=Arion vulgaris TaxID=1028688 RepID=A0A0B7BMG9_9EUPU
MFLTVAVSVIVSVIFCANSADGTAFSVGFKTSQTVAAGSTVVYDQVYLNDGNGYNTDTGVFKATKGGIYVFYFVALNVYGYQFLLDLYKNEYYMISAYSQPSAYNSAGHQLSLRLIKGDRVYIKARILSYLLGRPQEVYSTFTGYWIAA